MCPHSCEYYFSEGKHLFFFFCNQSLSGLELVEWASLPVSRWKSYLFLHLPSNEIINVGCHAQLFYMASGGWTQVTIVMKQALHLLDRLASSFIRLFMPW